MENDGAGDSKDMLYLVGGVALLIAGAGLIMAHPDGAAAGTGKSRPYRPGSWRGFG